MSIITVKIEGSKATDAIKSNELNTPVGNPMWSKVDNVVKSLQLAGIGAAVNAAKAGAFYATSKVLKACQPYFDEKDVLEQSYLLKLGDQQEKSDFGKDIRNKIILQLDAATKVEFLNAKIDVAQQNNIIKTAIVGRSGTVKEYIAAEDHIVNISGDLISGINFREWYPYDILQTLLEILKVQGSIEVASAYLQAFGISRLVMQRYKLSQSANRYINTQHFELDFLSDIEEDYFSITD